MNHPLLIEVEETLSAEEVDVFRLRETEAARQLASRRRKLLTLVRESIRLRDVALIVAIETAIVEGDLLRYTNSKGMRGSLTRALEELNAIRAHLDYIADKEVYRIIDQAHSLTKKRLNGLPRDDARLALASHRSRLDNMDKSRLDEEEKDILAARQDAMKAAEQLYTSLQSEALG